MDSDKEYLYWISSLKERIRSAQIKAAIAVNDELINLYWEIGKSIFEKQEQNRWGAKIIEQVAKDLRRELPDQMAFQEPTCLT